MLTGTEGDEGDTAWNEGSPGQTGRNGSARWKTGGRRQGRQRNEEAAAGQQTQ
jgi:hypothetical protein